MRKQYEHFKPTEDLHRELKTLRSGSHIKFNNNYHIVWIPKYRRHTLGTPKLKAILEDILRGQSESRGWKVLALEIMPDHIHLFLSVPPKYAIADVVKQLKGNTAIQLRRIFPELKKQSWSALWAKGYYISTAGFVSQEQVRKYIDAQSRAMVRAKEKPKPNPQTKLGDSPIPPTDKSVGILGDF